MRVLVVDDEVQVAKALGRLLRRHGFEVAIAASAPEALEALQASEADVVVSDFRLPGMNGAELLGQIAARWPQTGGLLISGFADLRLPAGAAVRRWPFVPKPWDDEALLAAVRTSLPETPAQVGGARG